RAFSERGSAMRVVSVGLSLALLLCLAPVPASPSGKDVDRERLDRVASRLLDVTAPAPGFAWPPVLTVAGPGGTQPLLRREGAKKRPVIRVAPAFLAQVVRGDEDVLALALAEALGHVVLGHALPEEGQAPVVGYSAAERAHACLKGAELLLRAG